MAGTENPDSPLISVEGLRKEYGSGPDRVVALADATFEIPEGQVVGLLGPNGAGKTTLIKSTLGLTVPTAGVSRINGVNVHENVQQAYEYVSAMLEGARNVYWRLTVKENLRYFARLQGVSYDGRDEYHEELIEELDLADKADVPVRNLSRGMKQKVSLGATLARETPIVFLDEPTLGLDVESKRQLQAKLDRLTTDRGRTVLLSSHDMDTVQKVCDRIIVVKDGHILVDESIDELMDMFSTRAYEVRTRKPPSQRARQRLETEFEVQDWEERGMGTTFDVVLRDPDRIYALTELLRDEGVAIDSLSEREVDLEEAFLEMVHDESREREAVSQTA